MPDTSLRTTFDTVPALYDEIRPGYPEALIQDVVALSGIPAGGRVLEVGCGTGQATAPFAARGYQMVCLDIGANFVEFARRKFSSRDNVSFVHGSFEDWAPRGEFDLVLAATAFHWVDPQVKYLRARDALACRGALAVFANTHVRKREGFFAEVQPLYDKYDTMPNAPKNDEVPARPRAPGLDAFADPIKRAYPWSREYTAEEYIKVLGTYSGHIALPDANRQGLFDGIADLIDTRYGGAITKHYEARLDLRRKSCG